MGKYFEHAFMGFCNSLQSFTQIFEVMLITLIYVTLPVWVLPYWLFFKRGDRDD